METSDWALVATGFFTFAAALITALVGLMDYRRRGHKIVIDVSPNTILATSQEPFKLEQISQGAVGTEKALLVVVRNMGGQPVIVSHLSLVLDRAKDPKQVVIEATIRMTVLPGFGALDPIAFPHSKIPHDIKSKWKRARICLTIAGDRKVFSRPISAPFNDSLDPPSFKKFEEKTYI